MLSPETILHTASTIAHTQARKFNLKHPYIQDIVACTYAAVQYELHRRHDIGQPLRFARAVARRRAIAICREVCALDVPRQLDSVADVDDAPYKPPHPLDVLVQREEEETARERVSQLPPDERRAVEEFFGIVDRRPGHRPDYRAKDRGLRKLRAKLRGH